jgi:plastocyanin
MRKRLLRSVVIVAVAALSTFTLGASANAQTDGIQHVSIKYLTFHPNNFYVAPGEAVEVTNVDWAKRGIPHTLTAKDGSFDTGFLTTDTVTFYAPTTPGQYKFICEIHPVMTGVLHVT